MDFMSLDGDLMDNFHEQITHGIEPAMTELQLSICRCTHLLV